MAGEKDPEFEAMDRCMKALLPLERAGRWRIISYLRSRFETEPAPAKES